MNAEAIATTSLNRKRPKADIGNGFDAWLPKAWAKALSLIKLAEVLTRNDMVNLTKAGSIELTSTWSARLEEMYVDE